MISSENMRQTEGHCAASGRSKTHHRALCALGEDTSTLLALKYSQLTHGKTISIMLLIHWLQSSQGTQSAHISCYLNLRRQYSSVFPLTWLHLSMFPIFKILPLFPLEFTVHHQQDLLPPQPYFHVFSLPSYLKWNLSSAGYCFLTALRRLLFSLLHC